MRLGESTTCGVSPMVAPQHSSRLPGSQFLCTVWHHIGFVSDWAILVPCHIHFIEGSLEVKLPTVWTDGKAGLGRVREEKGRRKKLRGEKEAQKKEDAGARKSRRVAKHCIFHCFVVPQGRKVGSLKRCVRSHLGRCEMKNCAPMWHEAASEVSMVKTPQPRNAFGRWDVEKVHAGLTRSKFRSQTIKKHSRGTFGNLIVEKMYAAVARSTFQSQKHCSSGAFLDIEMLNKCTPLWLEARVEVKMVKTQQCRGTFGSWAVQKVHAVAAQSTCGS